MINKKELRIGNYVMDLVSGVWMMVDEIGENVGAFVLNLGEYPLPKGWEMSPVFVTPEILYKSGFIQCKSPYKDKDAYVIGEDGQRLIFSNGYIFKPLIDGFLKIAYCEFLHQLQNVYFSLNGTELNIEI